MGSSINLTEIGTKLTNDDAQFHRDTVADLLERHSKGFPGAQPVSFARRHLDELESTNYFACEKTDGVRLLLYLTQWVGEGGESHEMQLLIDRKNEYYCLPLESLHLPAPGPDVGAFHNGTILDGELVRQKFPRGHDKYPHGHERLCYLIFDALAVDGENICLKPFSKRLQRIIDRVWKPYRHFAENPRYAEDVTAFPFQIEMKSMERPYGMEMMFNQRIPSLPHGNDGLIFTCVGTRYTHGTDQHILKWKPPQENTVDFKLQINEFPMLEDEEGKYPDYDTVPEIELLVYEGSSRYRYFATLTLTPAEWEAMKRMNQPFDHRIIECFRDPVTSHWRPKIEDDGTPRFRDDKTDANHISTVESVLESIKDAVTEQDLKARAGAIRKNFKAREVQQVEAQRREAQAQQMESQRRAMESERAKQQQQQQQHVAKQEGHGGRGVNMKLESMEDNGPGYVDD